MNINGLGIKKAANLLVQICCDKGPSKRRWSRQLGDQQPHEAARNGRGPEHCAGLRGLGVMHEEETIDCTGKKI